MFAQPPVPELISRYLAVLGVTQQEPGREALCELVAAHLTRIPFENISKLYNRKHHDLSDLPPLQLYLNGIERYRFGGTCYSNNFHFYSLLATLGYDVKLCAADMTNPDVHVVIMAQVDGREYLVDAGYGAPFLSPMPRDLATDYVVELGRDRYVLKPQDANGRSRLELYRDGEQKHGYLAKAAARRIEEFRHAITESFRPDATFLNCLLLTRFYSDRAVMIHNWTLVESQGSESINRSLTSRDQLVAAVEEHFDMPRAIVAEAVNELGDLQDPWT
ncbi:MAG: arylamine N-acetyltransferase [Terriglobales bacterium]|jgi:arylamine N-acetyltransferase